MPRRVIRLASLVLCFLLVGAVASAARPERDNLDAAMARATDPAELALAWEQAWLHLPGSEARDSQPPIIGPFGSAYVQERLKSLPRRVTWPTVVFLHGCTGIQAPGRRIAGMLTRMGYAVILPNSQARPIDRAIAMSVPESGVWRR